MGQIIIAGAMAKNRVIGKNNKIPWHLPADFRHYKNLVKGKTVLFGNNTYLSVLNYYIGSGNPVPYGKIIVLIDDPKKFEKVEGTNGHPEFVVISDPKEALEMAEKEDIYISGGMGAYSAFIPHADKLELTEIDLKTDGDAFFPEIDMGNYEKIAESRHEPDEKNKYGMTFLTYEKKENKMEDELIFGLIQQEKQRQKEGLELIPSENYVTQQVMDATGSIFTNKYSEGYPSFDELDASEIDVASKALPDRKYYGGQEFTDKIERLAIKRACELFGADHANVQPHSGAQANNAVYFAWLENGDTVLGMDLAHGGHLTHGAKVTQSAKIYNFVTYKTTKEGEIDYKEFEELAKKEQPRIVLVGFSAYAKIPDFEKMVKIAKKHCPNALLMADVAHVAGLIAGGVYPNPLELGFHVMTTTTHKTLRGPRGGLILSKGIVGNPLKKPEKTIENIPTLIDRAVFPGTQGGPLMHVVAAKAVAFHEAGQKEFKNYAKQVIKNAKVLAEELEKRGFRLVFGGTESHLIMIDMVKTADISGKDFEKALDKVNLNLNANSIPFDTLPPFRPSGVRLGTPAITSRGLKEKDMILIADWMKRTLEGREDGTELDRIKKEVAEFCKKFPLPNEQQ